MSNIHDLSKSQAAFGIISTPVEQWVPTTVDWYRHNPRSEDSAGYQFRRDELSLASRWQERIRQVMNEF